MQSLKMNVIPFMKYVKQWGKKKTFFKMHVTFNINKGTFWRIFENYFMVIS